ncbi:MAG: hypothetical protein QW048_01190, partial [Nitrososphaerota archaeon]
KKRKQDKNIPKLCTKTSNSLDSAPRKTLHFLNTYKITYGKESKVKGKRKKVKGKTFTVNIILPRLYVDSNMFSIILFEKD